VNDTEWVDGNTIPQLMTQGAGDNIYLSQFCTFLVSLRRYDTHVFSECA